MCYVIIASISVRAPPPNRAGAIERSKTRRKYHALLIADFYNKIGTQRTSNGYSLMSAYGG